MGTDTRIGTKNRKPCALRAQSSRFLRNRKPETRNRDDRGQAALEMLMVFAVALIIITALISASQMGAASATAAHEDTQARSALADISAAAKDVYAQGEGSKALIYIQLPSGIEPLYTSVSGTSIRLRVNGRDYTDTETFNMHGSLPGEPGNYWIWVVSEGNKVRVGYAMIDLSRQTIHVEMSPNETRTRNFQVTNVWKSDINITSGGRWPHNHTTLVLTGGTASLAPNESKTMGVTFTSDGRAAGIYLTTITINASDIAGNRESVELPIVLQVLSDINARPPLTAIPSIFNASLNRTNTTTRSFQICTNEDTSVTGVTFTPSSGAPGGWMSNTTALGPLGYDSCVEKSLTVTVPEDVSLGNYTGYVGVIGSGALGAEDSIALEIDVGFGTDIQGPDVRNISTEKRRVRTWEPTTINAVADDNLTGGSMIKGCQIRVDSATSWGYMLPVDGSFDTAIENVTYTYPDGFDWGPHTAYIKCTDFFDNVGPTKSHEFKIAKNILFVVNTGNMTDWGNWVTTEWSPSGFAWDYSVASPAQVASGAVNLTYFDAVIFIDWSSSMTNVVKSYQAAGGYLGLFGESAHLAVVDLGLGWHPDNPHPEMYINVVNNSHYVTQGFPLGLLQVTTSYTREYEIFWDTSATKLATSGWFYPSTDRTMLADANRTIFWGLEDPWRMNANGRLISQRVLDYMINQSMVE